MFGNTAQRALARDNTHYRTNDIKYPRYTTLRNHLTELRGSSNVPFEQVSGMILFVLVYLGYYVVEIPDETRQEAKPFQVYWNVPTMQCKSKKIPFENLYERYGIIQNTGDSFRGDEIAILYDPGVFPALLKNETSGKFKFRNGGVPQEGDLEKHWSAFRKVLEQSIPDPEFSGIGIIDFESWRPIFRQNFGVLAPYKDFSYQIERKLHWFWPEKAIQAKARQRFEEAARSFMLSTLVIAREMRPRAAWGYYAFPYCFNTPSTASGSCSSTVKEENDKLGWLWRESTALYPSTYLSRGVSAVTAASLVQARVLEASRLKRQAPIMPYFWYRYREGGFLTKDVLDAVIKTFYNSNASGFIIWGSSNDVNTAEKCKNLLNYTEEVLGPAIAKYTKLREVISTNKVRPLTEPPNTDVTSSEKYQTANNNKTNGLDYSTHNIHHSWFAMENNTQQIINNEQNFNKTNNITNGNGNLMHIKRNTLIELLFNILLQKDSMKDDESEEEIENDGVTDEIIENLILNHSSPSLSTTESSVLSANDTSGITLSITSVTTINPLNTTTDIVDKTYPLTETQNTTSSVGNQVNTTTSIKNYTNENSFSDISSSTNQFTNRKYQVPDTDKSVNYEYNTFETMSEKISTSIINSTEESVTVKVNEVVKPVHYEDTTFSTVSEKNSTTVINITEESVTDKVKEVVKPVNYEDNTFDTVSEKISTSAINTTEKSVTDEVKEVFSETNLTNEDKYDENSFTNITTIPPTTLENQVSATIKSDQNNISEIVNENKETIIINNTEKSGTDTVTEFVSETNLTNQDKYAINKNISNTIENTVKPEYFLDISNITNLMTIFTTNETNTAMNSYPPSQSDSSTTSNLLYILSTTYKPVTSIETSDIITQTKVEKKGYHWDYNNYFTSSKYDLIITTDNDKITTEDTSVESTSTVNLKDDNITNNDFTTENSSSSPKVDFVTEPVFRVDEKSDSNRDIDYEGEDLINNEQSSLIEYIETKNSNNIIMPKNAKKSFHEDVNFSDGTTEQINDSFNESGNFLEENDENELNSFSGETTTDSVRLLAF
ncbi:unnamed protein product [Chilo suppressalis]|uniref:Hyaluronidase n=1 Tax=Chilo suppressalis TaxID=168631 RepID=A0ABN8BAN6_CHISP|nr:unnamed protein product [Chilo suppressalis]